jgi:hypothetical protein
MPLIKLRSSSITESVNLRGQPTASSQISEIATTEFVTHEVANLVDSAPELLNTLAELAQSLGTDQNQA